MLSVGSFVLCPVGDPRGRAWSLIRMPTQVPTATFMRLLNHDSEVVGLAVSERCRPIGFQKLICPSIVDYDIVIIHVRDGRGLFCLLNAVLNGNNLIVIGRSSHVGGSERDFSYHRVLAGARLSED